MTTIKDKFKRLRNNAEKALKNQSAPPPSLTEPQILHELRVHQFELEAQN